MSGEQRRIVEKSCHGLMCIEAPSPSSQDSSGFTLLELLVVISMVALLMALLVPAVRRARQQAAAVVCQSQVRQWGILFATQGAMTEGPSPFPTFTTSDGGRHVDWAQWVREMERYHGSRIYDSYLCPIASRTDKRDLAKASGVSAMIGSTFSAWWMGPSPAHPNVTEQLGSYAVNPMAMGERLSIDNRRWESIHVKEVASIPFWLDGAWQEAYLIDHTSSPPPYEDSPDYTSRVCMNRHSGSLNHVFLDWSVRRVGLKELWMLKWQPFFDTAGPWTKAGGVQREDWPPWMRRFKDY
jgi:prepilin-type N-terminal cleavage/methylation domain-containing protein